MNTSRHPDIWKSHRNNPAGTHVVVYVCVTVTISWVPAVLISFNAV